MSITFKDREPTYPNRYKVTKENGTSEYITLERADEPRVAGTALNANTFNAAFGEIEEKLNGSAGKTVARNLLDNSDFTNPVNQRGLSSYSSNNSFTIDRWNAGSGSPFTLTLNKSGLSVTGDRVQLQQRFPKGFLSLDKSYTFAVYYVGEGVRLGNLETQNDLITPYFFTSNEAFDSACFYIRANETVAWAAVYEGEYTAETLPEYQPKGYGVELAECHRYYRKYDGYVATGMCKSTTQAWVPLILDPQMRIVPTVEVIGGCYIALGNTSYTSTLAGSALSTDNTLLLAFAPSNGSYENGAVCILNGTIAVSADI